MKIVFFGDSVTETGRDLHSPDDLGKGYVKFAAEKLRSLYPEAHFKIVNRGVGGDGVKELAARFQRDVVDEKPNIVVLQVGINNVWWRETDKNDFRFEYSNLVTALKTTGARLIIVQPFSLPVDDFGRLRPRLNTFNKIIDAIAKANDVPVIAMDEFFTDAAKNAPPTQFLLDGIHPTPHGHQCIADFVVKELEKSLV